MKRQRAAGSKAPFICGKTLKVGAVGGGWMGVGGGEVMPTREASRLIRGLHQTLLKSTHSTE